MEKKNKLIFILTLLVVLLGSVTVVNGNGLEDFLDKIGIKINKPQEVQVSNINNNTKITVVDEESAVIDAVKNASDSVVSIVISKDVPKYKEITTNPFQDFFGDGYIFNNIDFPGIIKKVPTGETEKQEVGGGSGFIISEDGLVVTNKHVVRDTTASYSVVLNNSKTYDLDILARDTVNDIAIGKIKNLTDKVKPLSLGVSSNLQLGQTVIAIGNALAEYRNTVTKGIISGIGRKIVAGDSYSGEYETLEDVIQTDAAINLGNSGGPLLNLKGEVIGINTAISSDGQSIGFAIPIDSVKSVIDSVKQTGKIVRPYLGIRYVEINDAFAKANNLKYNYGVLVIRGKNEEDLAVIPSGPADKAGILENDIILEIDGKKLDSETSLSKEVTKYKVGDKVKLKVFSKGNEKDVIVTLEERKE